MDSIFSTRDFLFTLLLKVGVAASVRGAIGALEYVSPRAVYGRTRSRPKLKLMLS